MHREHQEQHIRESYESAMELMKGFGLLQESEVKSVEIDVEGIAHVVATLKPVTAKHDIKVTLEMNTEDFEDNEGEEWKR